MAAQLAALAPAAAAADADPDVDVAAAATGRAGCGWALGGGYGAAVRRPLARAGLAWLRRRTGFFLAGVVAIAVVGLLSSSSGSTTRPCSGRARCRTWCWSWWRRCSSRSVRQCG